MNARPTSGSTPLRSGAEIRAIEAAAAWYARLCSGVATDTDRQGWVRWHAEHAMHRAAWERIESMQRRIASVPAVLAAPALGAAIQSEASTRRAVLRGAVLMLGTGSLAWWAWQQPLRQTLTADLRTGTGEQRDLVLADGSTLVLNTRTSVDLAFDASQRLLRLRSGEILVETAADPLAVGGARARPFLVDTTHGRIRALGTRFLVRTDGDITRVTVLDKAVEVRARTADQVPVLVHAGQQLRMGHAGIVGGVQAAGLNADAWRQGSLLAEDMPLAQLLDELGRYRSGVLACDPASAGLRVSGAFPIPDTDRALTVLAAGFPVRVEYRSRYWARIVPR